MRYLMRLLLLDLLLVRASAHSTRIHNSEHMTVSLGDIDDESEDDLEMIQPGSIKDRDVVNQKMVEFHEFVKRAKAAAKQHPWERLFMKDVEYKKSEAEYERIWQETVAKMREYNELERRRKMAEATDPVHFVRLINGPFIDKRQLSVKMDKVDPIKEDDDDDKDDDDDDDVDEEDKRLPQPDTGKDFKGEYDKQVTSNEEKAKVFKYSDQGKPEENMQESFQKIIDVKTPDNCTSITGFGIKSVECLIKNVKTHEMTGKQAFKQFMHIFLIWIIIYLTVAVPLWCIKGWGCCCIRSQYCRPREMVLEVQRYIANNPPGVYVNENGEEEHYAPSLREKELYDKINKKLLRM